MENLSVGQVVFVFVPEDHGILPVQVVEEVVHRKLAGVDTRYFVRASPDANAKVFQLNVKKHHVFLDLEGARQFMIENATRAIDEICNDAAEIHRSFETTERKVTPRVAHQVPAPEQIETPRPSVGVSQVRLPTGEVVDVIL
jgi:hypothetical protein